MRSGGKAAPRSRRMFWKWCINNSSTEHFTVITNASKHFTTFPGGGQARGQVPLPCPCLRELMATNTVDHRKKKSEHCNEILTQFLATCGKWVKTQLLRHSVRRTLRRPRNQDIICSRGKWGQSRFIARTSPWLAAATVQGETVTDPARRST